MEQIVAVLREFQEFQAIPVPRDRQVFRVHQVWLVLTAPRDHQDWMDVQETQAQQGHREAKVLQGPLEVTGNSVFTTTWETKGTMG